ncbi:hypothetical protein BKA69DRAFT_1124149 [Paraphysoderma sedebokerense]|nr:hypothetical protein BKA69DRAFT_1124149 [Paraphysoderma sedebokerense]
MPSLKPLAAFFVILSALVFLVLADPLALQVRHTGGSYAVSTDVSSSLYETEQPDVLLISTLDGAVHCIDKGTGHRLWTLDDGIGPLVKTSSNFSTPEQNDENTKEKPEEFDDIGITDELITVEEDENRLVASQLTYIAEPIGDGALYAFQPGRVIQKLPLPIKTLVNKSPFRSADGTVYIGTKTTRFYAVDATTGKVLHIYSMNEFFDSTCPKPADTLSSSAIFLGRIDYNLNIFDGKSKSTRWTVTLSEYTSASLDGPEFYEDGRKDHKDTKIEQEFLLTYGHEGDVYFTSKEGLVQWVRKFNYPAIAAFEIQPGVSNDGGFHVAKRTPITLPRDQTRTSTSSAPSAHIGLINGSLYALSSLHYPTLHQTPNGEILPSSDADSETTDLIEMPYLFGCQPGAADFPNCLLGKRPVIENSPSQSIKTIDEPGKRIKLPPLQSFKFISAASFVLLACILIGTFIYRKRRPSSPSKKKKKNGKGLSEQSNSSNGSSKGDSPEPRKKKKRVRVSSQLPSQHQENHGKDEEHEHISDNESNFTEFVTPSPLNNATVITLPDGLLKINSLVVSTDILGYGSHGTVVYKGLFDGRPVAIKRLLLDFYDVAHHEVSLLLESDDHPNVVRYYCKEQCDQFLYIALELCQGSLADVVDKLMDHTVSNGTSVADASKMDSEFSSLVTTFSEMTPRRILHQMLKGLSHLHNLKIVHRDIKPQNILLSLTKPKKANAAGNSREVRILISDFGLCKRLDQDQSSFHNTTNHQAGTFGWRAPELLANSSSGNHTLTSTSSMTVSSTSTSTTATSDSVSSSSRLIAPTRITRSIDIFSMGCVFYYVLTNGDHPFGDRYIREVNILRNECSLDKLDSLGDEGILARDMISSMIHQDPENRPSASHLLHHPYFWNPSRRLAFLQDVSDRFEIEEKDPPSPLLKALENNADEVIGDWYRRIDKVLADNLGKYRKYNRGSVQDLLRAMRNKKHHYQDLPENVQKTLGPLPHGFLNYFTSRFPKLFLHVYYVVALDEHLPFENIFRSYFVGEENI